MSYPIIKFRGREAVSVKTNGGPLRIATGGNALRGAAGPSGADGQAFDHSGSGVPSSGLGTDGDTYLDLVNGDTYLKGGGVWTLVGDIRGVGDDGLLSKMPFGDGTAYPMPVPDTEHYFPAGAYRDAANDIHYFAFTKGYRHEKSEGGELVLVKSRDGGRSFYDWITCASFAGKGIQHASMQIMGSGRMGFVCTLIDTSDVTTTAFVYSDDYASTSPSWTTETVTTSGFFVNGPGLPLPAAEGGHDTLGFRWYGHSSGAIRVLDTDDNGATWTDSTLIAKPAGITLVEPFAGKLSDGTYLVLIRDDDGGNMRSVVGPAQDGFGSLTDAGLALGANPVSFTEYASRVWVTACARPGTGIGGYQNALLHYAEDTSAIAATGTMTSTAPKHVTMTEPANIGYGFYMDLPLGKIMFFCAGEDQTGSGNPGGCKLYVMSPPSTVPGAAISPRPNLIRNGLFRESSRGTSFTLDASSLTPLVDCWRWSGSGASGTAEITALDADVRRLFDIHTDTYLAFDTSGGPDDYASIEQYFWGLDYHALCGSVVTLSIGGVGTLPGQLDVTVTRFYGSGGSSPDVLPTVVFAGRTSGNAWRAQATITIPSLDGKTVGTDPYIRVQIRASGSAAWAGGFVFAKLEIGDSATPYPVASPNDMRPVLDQYVEVVSYAASTTVQGQAQGASGANVLCAMPFSKKFRTPPTVTLNNPTNIRFYATAANVSAVAAAPYNITAHGFETNLTMGSGTLASYAFALIQTNGGEFSYLVDAEA